MQKSILLFLCAVLGVLLAGCYENDSSGPDMVDPWLRERTPLSFRVESQVGEAIITDDWRHDETGTIRFQLVTGGIADMTKVKLEEITLQYNAKASVQAGSTIDLSSGSCDIVVTAETGETRTYTVSYDPFVEPFEGVYDMDYDVNNHDESQYENGNAFALWFFGGSNDGCYCQSLMWKHWNWNGGYKPMVEDDNVLTITLTGVDSQTGDTYGTCYNDAGPDGKYADFRWNSDGGHDLKKFYRCIPEGESTWRKDGKTGLITFTAADGTAHTATFYSEPTTLTYEQEGKSFSCQIMNQGLEFPVAGTPMSGWTNYSDFDKYVQNPQRFIVKMKKRQQ